MKIDRLLGILTQLLNRKIVTAPQIAEYFGVSRRTILRDIDDLDKAGFPIVTRQGYGGGISLMEGFTFDNKLLKRDDLSQIITGLKGLESVSDDSQIGDLINRISRDTEDSVNIDLASHYKKSLMGKISMLKEAIGKHFCISFTYYSKTGEEIRVVEPCRVHYRWSDWYLFGYCRNRENFRMFKLNRLWRLEHTSLSYEMRVIPEEEQDHDRYFRDEKMVEVLFDNSVKYRVIESYGPDSFHERVDGTLHFISGYTDREFIMSWILGFGDKALVISPQDLAEEICERLKKIVGKYLNYNE